MLRDSVTIGEHLSSVSLYELQVTTRHHSYRVCDMIKSDIAAELCIPFPNQCEALQMRKCRCMQRPQLHGEDRTFEHLALSLSSVGIKYYRRVLL